MHGSLASQPRARKEQRGPGAGNGLRGRELSQESPLPRQQGNIKQIRVNVLNNNGKEIRWRKIFVLSAGSFRD